MRCDCARPLHAMDCMGTINWNNGQLHAGVISMHWKFSSSLQMYVSTNVAASCLQGRRHASQPAWWQICYSCEIHTMLPEQMPVPQECSST